MALAKLLQGSDAGIVLNEHLAMEGALVFDHACKLGAEGIVSKRVAAPYRSGHGLRSARRAWFVAKIRG